MTGKTNESTEIMVDILLRVQQETGHVFTLDEIYSTTVLTIKKTELNGKSSDYIPLLFENELRDLVMRNHINFIGGLNKCAKCVATSLA